MLREVVHLLYREGGDVKAIYALNVKYFKEEGQWLGECLELGTATFADTLEEVQEELVEAIALQVNEVDRDGFAEEYLAERGVETAHTVKCASESDRYAPLVAV